MLEYKVIKFQPWLFSTLLITAIRRITHAPESHWWKPLPWFCLLRRRPWTIEALAGATVEWQLEWQWSNSRSFNRVIRSYRLSYNCSMLECKVFMFPPRLFSTMSNTAIGRKTHAPDSHRWKILPWFYLLRPQPWTVQATVWVTVEWQKEWTWRNNRSYGRVRLIHRLSYNRSMESTKTTQ